MPAGERVQEKRSKGAGQDSQAGSDPRLVERILRVKDVVFNEGGQFLGISATLVSSRAILGNDAHNLGYSYEAAYSEAQLLRKEAR